MDAAIKSERSGDASLGEMQGTFAFDGPFRVVGVVPRLTSVLSRVRIDLTSVLRDPAGEALGAAASVCTRCRSTSACDRWCCQQGEGEGSEPPAFCPALAALNIGLLS